MMNFVGYVLGYWKNMFDYHSHDSRMAFFVGSITNAVLGCAVFYMLAFLLGVAGGIADGEENTLLAVGLFIGILMYVAYTVAYVSALNRRLRDAGFNPWWTLGTFVPFFQLVTFVFAFLPTKLVTDYSVNKQPEA